MNWDPHPLPKYKNPYRVPAFGSRPVFTCLQCGHVPGERHGRALTTRELWGLADAGYTLDRNRDGDIIAAAPLVHVYAPALLQFHRAGHPKPTRPTWHQRILAGE